MNTHPPLVTAAAQCFIAMGVGQVTVGEGPGHQRDTEAILMSTGLRTALDSAGARFVDLNRDALSRIPFKIKVKTYHWAGATLSLKNLFRVIPGAKYVAKKHFCIGTELIDK